ncbi:MAG: hypothetical protein IJB97_09165, partial [Clostridia bacterium]|nr:hypothetical protein [Clostridia bacterium]
GSPARRGFLLYKTKKRPPAACAVGGIVLLICYQVVGIYFSRHPLFYELIARSAASAAKTFCGYSRLSDPSL